MLVVKGYCRRDENKHKRHLKHAGNKNLEDAGACQTLSGANWRASSLANNSNAIQERNEPLNIPLLEDDIAESM